MLHYKKWNILKTIERIDMKFSGGNQIQVLNRINPPMANPNGRVPDSTLHQYENNVLNMKYFFLKFDVENDDNHKTLYINFQNNTYRSF